MSPRLRESCHSLAFSSARSLSTDNISFSSFEVLASYPVQQHDHHLHHNPNHHHLTKCLFQNLPKVLGGSHEPPDYPLPPQPTPSYQGFLLNFTFLSQYFSWPKFKVCNFDQEGQEAAIHPSTLPSQPPLPPTTFGPSISTISPNQAIYQARQSFTTPTSSTLPANTISQPATTKATLSHI